MDKVNRLFQHFAGHAACEQGGWGKDCNMV